MSRRTGRALGASVANRAYVVTALDLSALSGLRASGGLTPGDRDR
jgi:hypothetical protein